MGMRLPWLAFNVPERVFVLTAFVAAVVVVSLAAPVWSAGVVVPPGMTASNYVGLSGQPTGMQFAPDGTLFVTRQDGGVAAYRNGANYGGFFIPVATYNERGMLGVALDPQFATNRHVYVHYTANTAVPHGRVSRVTLQSNPFGFSAVAGSELPLLELSDLAGNGLHNGGGLHVGPDGNLYVGTGDDINGSNSQSLTTTHGKILRFNTDGSIPNDNPFFAQTTGVNRAIWAMGLRNAFSLSFQPGTGRMFINDVGAGSFEEINDGIAGSNYGWPATEGYTSDPNYRTPLHAYAPPSGFPFSAAITGGTFYNPSVEQLGAGYVGKYFFADYAGGWIKTYDPTTGAVAPFATGFSGAVDLEVGPDGALYVLSTGNVTRIAVPEPSAPLVMLLGALFHCSMRRRAPCGWRMTWRRTKRETTPSI
jgi:glucose/arabinose dehydrogenase